MCALADFRCDCGSPDIVAIAPGDEPERAADLFIVARGEPARCWCAACWPQSWRKAA